MSDTDMITDEQRTMAMEMLNAILPDMQHILVSFTAGETGLHLLSSLQGRPDIIGEILLWAHHVVNDTEDEMEFKHALSARVRHDN